MPFVICMDWNIIQWFFTAYNNTSEKIELKTALYEMQKRGKWVSGGSCGFLWRLQNWYKHRKVFPIILQSTPFATEAWGLSNQMIAKALEAIARLEVRDVANEIHIS